MKSEVPRNASPNKEPQNDACASVRKQAKAGRAFTTRS